MTRPYIEFLVFGLGTLVSQSSYVNSLLNFLCLCLEVGRCNELQRKTHGLFSATTMQQRTMLVTLITRSYQLLSCMVEHQSNGFAHRFVEHTCMSSVMLWYIWKPLCVHGFCVCGTYKWGDAAIHVWQNTVSLHRLGFSPDFGVCTLVCAPKDPFVT